MKLSKFLTFQQRRILEIYKVSRAYSDIVIKLGMGKGSKKKPMTKKERAERRKKRKEKRSKTT
jgi:U3 small nucleolar ribonucleoprotein component